VRRKKPPAAGGQGDPAAFAPQKSIQGKTEEHGKRTSARMVQENGMVTPPCHVVELAKLPYQREEQPLLVHIHGRSPVITGLILSDQITLI
jgi:hypothetical protein